jgi:hypothetical protein
MSRALVLSAGATSARALRRRPSAMSGRRQSGEGILCREFAWLFGHTRDA